jgi:hypothetical protein
VTTPDHAGDSGGSDPTGDEDRPLPVTSAPLAEPRRSAVHYPGGLAARYRWAGSGQARTLDTVAERGGSFTDLGALVSPSPDRLCRAELRVEAPAGTWTVRLASPIFHEPAGMLWDTHALLIVVYGFALYALAARSGELQWHHASRTPLLTVLGSSRLDHVIAQSELETVALAADGEVLWRVGHADVIADAGMVGGRLVLSTYGGLLTTLDPVTGRSLDR